MSETERPEPDAVQGAPHPRFAAHVFGQDAAARDFLQAFTGGRLHHGWLLSGPRGVGKATLAWTIARFLLATPDPGGDGGLFGAPPPPETLDIDPDHPVAHRVRALSDPGLFLLRRGGAGSTDSDRHKNAAAGKFSDVIRVDDVRRLRGFLALSATEGGRRVVIVDEADALNPQAANAILKMLEEPPARTTFLLIAHQPAGLLPTIRSRCRTLRLTPLKPADMARALDQAGLPAGGAEAEALAALAGGSVGAAVRLAAEDGLTLYRQMLSLLSGLPQLDRAGLGALADSCAGPTKATRLDTVMAMADVLAARLSRTGATGLPPHPALVGDEAATLTRLAPDPAAGRRWADAAATASARARHARAVNIDPAALVADLMLHLARAS